LKKPIENSCNYLEASIPPNPKSNGFAGEPTITATVTAMEILVKIRKKALKEKL
jgi:hypothetical protein